MTESHCIDPQGYRLTGADQQAAADFDAALNLLLRMRADPLAAADDIIARTPQFVMAHVLRATLFLLAAEPTATAGLAQSLTEASALAPTASPRERMHLEALKRWIEADYIGASAAYARLSEAFPRDLLALFAGHQTDFFTGRKTMLADRIRSALPYWSSTIPGHSFLFGMLAFGLEENGDYPAAMDAGEQALAVVPDNSWAIHAIAHCHEMTGAREKGIRWLRETGGQWQDNALLSVHNWWHLALFHLGLGDHASAIAIYDDHIRPAAFAPAIELVDASAMLWRLKLAGAAVGERFAVVSDAWDHAFACPDAHGHYGFNDLHAAMAHAGAGRLERAPMHLADLSLRAASGAQHGSALANAGLPMVRAIYAFAAGHHSQAADLLWRHGDQAIQLGGSDAQRDILRQTLLAATAGRKVPQPAVA